MKLFGQLKDLHGAVQFGKQNYTHKDLIFLFAWQLSLQTTQTHGYYSQGVGMFYTDTCYISSAHTL